MSAFDAVGAIGLWLALGGPLVLAWWTPDGDRHPPLRLGSFLVAQGALAALVFAVLGIAVLAQGLGAADLGMVRGWWSPVSWLGGLAVAALFVFAFGPVVAGLLRRMRLAGFDAGLRRLSALPVWCLVLAVGVGSVAEEFLYRAYGYERLLAWTGSPLIAAALPLVLFAAAHAPLWGLPAAATTLVSGVILTVFYAWQRDLVANVVAHGVTDLIGIVLATTADRRRRLTG